jgi:transposase
METEGTNRLVQDTQIKQLQLILQEGQKLKCSLDEVRGIAYDLIALYELLAQEDSYEQIG